MLLHECDLWYRDIHTRLIKSDIRHMLWESSWFSPETITVKALKWRKAIFPASHASPCALSACELSVYWHTHICSSYYPCKDLQINNAVYKPMYVLLLIYTELWSHVTRRGNPSPITKRTDSQTPTCTYHFIWFMGFWWWTENVYGARPRSDQQSGLQLDHVQLRSDLLMGHENLKYGSICHCNNWPYLPKHKHICPRILSYI